MRSAATPAAQRGHWRCTACSAECNGRHGLAPCWSRRSAARCAGSARSLSARGRWTSAPPCCSSTDHPSTHAHQTPHQSPCLLVCSLRGAHFPGWLYSECYRRSVPRCTLCCACDNPRRTLQKEDSHLRELVGCSSCDLCYPERSQLLLKLLQLRLEIGLALVAQLVRLELGCKSTHRQVLSDNGQLPWAAKMVGLSRISTCTSHRKSVAVSIMCRTLSLSLFARPESKELRNWLGHQYDQHDNAYPSCPRSLPTRFCLAPEQKGTKPPSSSTHGAVWRRFRSALPD